jgi:hypothetical protein
MSTAKIVLLSVAAFILTGAACALLAWMSGYNFDHRNLQVGENVAVTLWAAMTAASATALACYFSRK